MRVIHQMKQLLLRQVAVEMLSLNHLVVELHILLQQCLWRLLIYLEIQCLLFGFFDVSLPTLVELQRLLKVYMFAKCGGEHSYRSEPACFAHCYFPRWGIDVVEIDFYDVVWLLPQLTEESRKLFFVRFLPET